MYLRQKKNKIINYGVKYNKRINGLLLVFIKKMHEASSKCIKEKLGRTSYYKFAKLLTLWR